MAGQSLQYVVLWHSEIAEPHFDLMFETFKGSELATWRAPTWPIEKPTPLVRLKDHRRVYLTFEGDISGKRGRVERVDGGNCHLAIGENSVWIIHLAKRPDSLKVSQTSGANWEGSPFMGSLKKL